MKSCLPHGSIPRDSTVPCLQSPARLPAGLAVPEQCGTGAETPQHRDTRAASSNVPEQDTVMTILGRPDPPTIQPTPLTQTQTLVVTQSLPCCNEVAAQHPRVTLLRHLHLQVDLTLHLLVRVHRHQAEPAVNA